MSPMLASSIVKQNTTANYISTNQRSDAGKDTNVQHVPFHTASRLGSIALTCNNVYTPPRHDLQPLTTPPTSISILESTMESFMLQSTTNKFTTESNTAAAVDKILNPESYRASLAKPWETSKRLSTIPTPSLYTPSSITPTYSSPLDSNSNSAAKTVPSYYPTSSTAYTAVWQPPQSKFTTTSLHNFVEPGFTASSVPTNEVVLSPATNMLGFASNFNIPLMPKIPPSVDKTGKKSAAKRNIFFPPFFLLTFFKAKKWQKKKLMFEGVG